MKKIVFILVIASLTKIFSQNNFVYTEGKDIKTPDGNSLLLKGINLGNWLVPEGYMFHFKHETSPRLIDKVFKELIGPSETRNFWKYFQDNYITKKDIEFIKECGFNSIRVPFNYKLFIVEDNPEIELQRGMDLLERVMKWSTKQKLYVILDMHCAPGGQTGDNIDDSYGYPFLMESEESQNETAAIWKRIAENFKDEKYLIGYDLLNEPIATYFDAEKLNPNLEPLYKKITNAIREVDKNHLIFLGGAQWDGNFSVFGKPFDDKLVYSFHKYWSETTQNVIQEYLDFRDKYNVPIWLGESGENTNEWISNFRQLLEKNNIGWCFWPYKKLESDRGIVSINMTPEFDLIIQFANSDIISFEDIRKHRPDTDKVKKALKDYLHNCKFENCKINNDYLEALGLGASDK